MSSEKYVKSFGEGMAKGAGYILSKAVIGGAIGLVCAGPAGAVIGAKLGAFAGAISEEDGDDDRIDNSLSNDSYWS